MTVLFSHSGRKFVLFFLLLLLDCVEVACLVSAHVNIDWIIFFFFFCILLMSCVDLNVCVVCVLFCFSERGGLEAGFTQDQALLQKRVFSH